MRAPYTADTLKVRKVYPSNVNFSLLLVQMQFTMSPGKMLRPMAGLLALLLQHRPGYELSRVKVVQTLPKLQGNLAEVPALTNLVNYLRSRVQKWSEPQIPNSRFSYRLHSQTWAFMAPTQRRN